MFDMFNLLKSHVYSLTHSYVVSLMIVMCSCWQRSSPTATTSSTMRSSIRSVGRANDWQRWLHSQLMLRTSLTMWSLTPSTGSWWLLTITSRSIAVATLFALLPIRPVSLPFFLTFDVSFSRKLQICVDLCLEFAVSLYKWWLAPGSALKTFDLKLIKCCSRLLIGGNVLRTEGGNFLSVMIDTPMTVLLCLETKHFCKWTSKQLQKSSDDFNVAWSTEFCYTFCWIFVCNFIVYFVYVHLYWRGTTECVAWLCMDSCSVSEWFLTESRCCYHRWSDSLSACHRSPHSTHRFLSPVSTSHNHYITAFIRRLFGWSYVGPTTVCSCMS